MEHCKFNFSPHVYVTGFVQPALVMYVINVMALHLTCLKSEWEVDEGEQGNKDADLDEVNLERTLRVGGIEPDGLFFFTYLSLNLIKTQLCKIIIHAKLNRNSQSAALPSTKIKMKGNHFEERKYDLE